MEAVILAGGRGTRLQSVVSDVPKPMAPVNGRPFLEYLLDSLVRANFHHVVLAVGYKRQIIIDYFGKEYRGITIDYSEEETPLGTGGAIKAALKLCDAARVFVLNGDTYFDVDYMAMRKFSLESNSSLVIAVKQMENFDRYGCLEIENGRIVKFREKRFCKRGFISGGIYDISRGALERVSEDAFSFERDFAEKFCGELKPPAYVSDGYFVDIGVPEDYMLVCRRPMFLRIG